MLASELFESPEADVAAGSRATKAASLVASAIYNGAQGQLLLLNGEKHIVYTAGALGLTGEMPELADLIVAVTYRNPKAIGMSGMMGHLERPILGRHTQVIIIECLPRVGYGLNVEAAKSAAGTVEFIKVLTHEFVHVFDSKRAPERIAPKTRSEKSAADYYNDAFEFNAYYHDLAGRLTAIVAAVQRGEGSATDYADIYNITGDFVRDMAFLVGQDRPTRAFVAALRKDRTRALVRRLYKLHSYVTAMVRAEENRRVPSG